MATLNSSNISNGNTIQPNDLLQLYDAFTSGGGTTGVYSVSISGSLTGSATSSSFASTASYVTTAQTASYVLSASYAISSSRTITSSYALTASSVVSSSYAISSSYAPVSQVNSQRYINSSTPGTVSSANFQFIAGGGNLNTGILTSSAYPTLAGKTLGQNVWITATYIGDVGTVTTVDPTLIVNLSSSGAIIIEQKTPQDDAQIVWTGIFI